MPNNSGGLWTFIVTVIVAMVGRVLPFPPLLADINPDWVLLVLIYWSLATPERTGVFSAWVVGLLVDVLTGRLLGQHALIYALISYLVVKWHKRIRHYPAPQQSIVVFFCLFVAYSLTYWIEGLQGKSPASMHFWWPVLTGAFIWPVVFGLLRMLRTRG